ncbi:MAG: ATP-dependent DNA ligase [Verrucomicrobiales bacterium]|nr:ATP-dependent DNA ligase [Verrucomicrobiales bacterium]
MSVTWNQAAFLPDAQLWLDPHHPCNFAFVSHAHADHFAPHRRILCSAPTYEIIAKRFGKRESEFLVLPYHETTPIADGRFEVELIPAGHIAGSTQIFVRDRETRSTLLYTGDFKTRPSAAAEPCEWKQADTLIMETTFGLPKFQFPPTSVVIADLAKFARETIEDGEIPILMGYSLGKAQELILAIHETAPELRFQVHNTVKKMNRVVESLGWKFPPCGKFDPKERDPAGHVVIIPPNALKSQVIRRLKNKRVAMATGWGIDPNAKYRYQCDEVFPLSDHAGYDDLLGFVENVNPSLTYTLHGYAEEFATDLRNRGREAWSLISDNQVELQFESDTRTAVPGPNPTATEDPRPESPFGDFVTTCEAVREVTGKLRKREILAVYLSSLNEESDLELAARYLSGVALSKTAEIRTLNVGWAIIRRTLLEMTGLSLAQYRQISTAQADSARTAHLLLAGKTKPEAHSLDDMNAAFETIAEARGPSRKIEILKNLLGSPHHAEAAFVVGILGGDLRIGLKEGLLEEAIAVAFDRDLKSVREAHMRLGDPGKTAVLAKSDRLSEAGVTPFHPLKVMLASPEPEAADIWKRLGETDGGVWLEDKFDGIRAQIHKIGNRVEIFSRDQRSLSAEFPELVSAAKKIKDDFIFDGEIIAFAEGKKLTFFDLQKRLGRIREGDLFFGEAVPVKFLAFDLLWRNGETLLAEPLSSRVKNFESIGFVRQIKPVHSYRARSAAEIDEHFYAARKRENEGLIAKDPDSPYSPGRRGKAWLKLKKAAATLDCVVVRAQQGHGKRAHVLSDYTFSLRDEETGELRVLGKAYSGLTDLEIEELTEHFKSRTLEKRRNVHFVEPETVLEIAFDSIQPSKRHDSGLALRFPRIKAIRRDKSIDEIDTVQTARKLLR